MVLAPTLQIMSDSVLFPIVLSITNIAIMVETTVQPVENTNSIDDNPNPEDKKSRLHIEMQVADMDCDLLLMAAIPAVEECCLAKRRRARPAI